jgi:hypothetical protein
VAKAGVLDEIVYGLSINVDRKSFNEAQKTIENLGSLMARLGKQVATYTIAILGASAVINRHTAEQDLMAKSVGSTLEKMEGLSIAMAGVGIGVEEVSGMYEKLRDNLESSEKSEAFVDMSKGLKTLGIDLQKFKKLTSDEQFDLISEKGLSMSNIEEASYAIGNILGSEGAKGFAYMIDQGMSQSDITRAQNMSFLDERAVEGAKEFNHEMSMLYKIFASLTKQMAGILGKYLTPILKKFKEWLFLAKDFIKLELDKVLQVIAWAMNTIFTVLEFGVGIIMSVIDAVGGLARVLNFLIAYSILAGISLLKNGFIALFTVIRKATMAVVGFSSAVGARAMLFLGGQLLVLLGVLALFEDIMVWTQGGDSMIGLVVGKDFDAWLLDLKAVWGMVQDGSIWQALWDGYLAFGKWFGDILWDWAGGLWDIFANIFKSIGAWISNAVMSVLPDWAGGGKPAVPIEVQPDQGNRTKVTAPEFFGLPVKNNSLTPSMDSLGAGRIPGSTKTVTDNSVFNVNTYVTTTSPEGTGTAVSDAVLTVKTKNLGSP